ncbi:hypothetical protein TNCV_1145711 [Trichonephila clavipes]|nr:hypothetical protein TNCV_1145711 [Trichonephila clavipes]
MCGMLWGDVLQHAYIIREHLTTQTDAGCGMSIFTPQEMWHKLVLSMRRRWEATIAVRRTYTILRNICLLFFLLDRQS